MPAITMTDAEAEILLGVLEDYLSDLRFEIADTERKELRDVLKAREDVLNGLIARLRGDTG